ncbi:MAG: hypothetical protein IPK75_20465 [Acidobacteria bacterium]|nr:hypothetical protein [Acidobacteriota bacterium]
MGKAKYLPDLARVVEAVEFDVEPIAAGHRLAERRRMFVYQQGPHRKTSLYRPMQLQCGYSMSVRAIQVSIGSSALLEDAREFIEHTTIKLLIQQRFEYISPLMCMASTETPWCPIWTCEHCGAVFVQQAACPGCGSRSLKADLAAIAGDARLGYTLEATFHPRLAPEILDGAAFEAILETEYPAGLARQALTVLVALKGNQKILFQ